MQVVGVDQDHPPVARDAAVAVGVAVDRGVELVVAADRLQQQPARRAPRASARCRRGTRPCRSGCRTRAGRAACGGAGTRRARGPGSL